MLRITFSTTVTQQPCLRLEGRLVGPWVTELETAIQPWSSSSAPLVLDLGDVLFVDDAGIALLQDLRTNGVTLSRVTPFIEELLRTRRI